MRRRFLHEKVPQAKNKSNGGLPSVTVSTESARTCIKRWHGKFHGGKDSGALTGEAVDGAEDTESTPAGRDRGGMKTVAGAAGDAGAGEGEAPAAAAKAAAVLCCAGAEARVRSPGVERRMLAAERMLARGRVRRMRRMLARGRVPQAAGEWHKI